MSACAQPAPRVIANVNLVSGFWILHNCLISLPPFWPSLISRHREVICGCSLRYCVKSRARLRESFRGRRALEGAETAAKEEFFQGAGDTPADTTVTSADSARPKPLLKSLPLRLPQSSAQNSNRIRRQLVK